MEPSQLSPATQLSPSPTTITGTASEPIMTGGFGLPVTVAGPVDIGRLLRELEAVDAELNQEAIRGGEPKVPKTSHGLEQIMDSNKLDIALPASRTQLLEFLRTTKSHAPVLHISFSADPSVEFMAKLVTYLRKEIHPAAMVTVGLQPNIGAGCIVRSTNKYFDFSLRQDFYSKRGLLLEKLDEVLTAQAPAEAPTNGLLDSAPGAAAEPVPIRAPAPAAAVHEARAVAQAPLSAPAQAQPQLQGAAA